MRSESRLSPVLFPMQCVSGEISFGVFVCPMVSHYIGLLRVDGIGFECVEGIHLNVRANANHILGVDGVAFERVEGIDLCPCESHRSRLLNPKFIYHRFSPKFSSV